MANNVPIYDMVFASDHEIGKKIMTDLYRKAAAREPGMVAEARTKAALRREERREERTGQGGLFEPVAREVPLAELAWEPTDSWDPKSRAWWPA
jgi:hypothetical protein